MPKDKNITIKDIAEILNVSPSMVCRAFNPKAYVSDEKRTLIVKTAAKYGYIPNKMASRLTTNTIRIGIIICDTVEGFKNDFIAGANAAAAALHDYKVICDVHIVKASQKSDISRINTVMEDSGYDGIVTGLNFDDKTIACYNRLAASGVKIALVNDDNDDIKNDFTSRCDFGTAGAIAANLLDMLLPADDRNALIFSGNQVNGLQHRERNRGFAEYAAGVGINIVNIYEYYIENNWLGGTVPAVIANHPEVNGIYINNADSIKICDYIEEHGLGGRIKVIASDIFPEMLGYIERGTVAATIFQDPFKQMYNAVMRIYKMIAEDYKSESTLLIEPQIVMKSNMKLYDTARTPRL